MFRRIGLRPSRFHSCVWEWPFYFRLDGAEWNENVTVFLTATMYMYIYVMRIRKVLISNVKLDHMLYLINYGIHACPAKLCLLDFGKETDGA